MGVSAFYQCVGFPAGKHDDVVDVCALIGLALDKTHPTFIPTPVVRKKRDRWDRAFERLDNEPLDWKVS